MTYIYSADYAQRVEFREWFLERQELQPNILWSDEARFLFHINGEINTGIIVESGV